MDLKLKFDIVILLIIPLLSCIFLEFFLAERKPRKKTEQKLQALENSLSKAESTDSKIIYTSYFGTSINELYGLANKKRTLIKKFLRMYKKVKRRLKSFLFSPLRLWSKIKWYSNKDFFKN